MLIEFSVENFRSIKNEQVLSLLSSKSKKSKNNTFSVKLSSQKSVSLLSSAAIYGANASGKTNIIKAISTMINIVVNLQERLFHLPHQPFAFNKETIRLPTKFNIIFIIDDVQYEYGFVIDKYKVYAEWLYKDRQTIFTRELKEIDSLDYIYKFPSGNLSGQKETWKNSTRPDALFLSIAVSLNSIQLKPIYDWFNHTLEIKFNFNIGDIDKTTTLCDIKFQKQEILDFLQEADFYITDINAKRHNDIAKIPSPVLEGIFKHNFQTINETLANIFDIKFKHPTNYNDGQFLDIRDESDGTQKMYVLAGYWLEALKTNKVIFFDELNNSLHPLLVRFLINKFNFRSKKSNSQLIFTTHDISILDQKILDRDQIWFCERSSEQATILKSLLEFKARSDISNYERAYLSGRYGAIPIIDEE
ncbi:MAG: AAA family ATPase [Neisseriaceae bacterium]